MVMHLKAVILTWEQGGLGRKSRVSSRVGGVWTVTAANQLLCACKADKPFFFISLMVYVDRIPNSQMKNEVKFLSC